MPVLCQLLYTWYQYGEGLRASLSGLCRSWAARCITKLGWFTPTKKLLTQCNWLSIKQLIFYHTALQVWKVKVSEQPVYIHNMFQPSSTRSSSQGTLLVPAVEKSTSTKSFIVRSATTWNHLPPSIREAQQLGPFKVMLKNWVRDNISIEWAQSSIPLYFFLIFRSFRRALLCSSKNRWSSPYTLVKLNLILKRKCSNLTY